LNRKPPGGEMFNKLWLFVLPALLMAAIAVIVVFAERQVR
jgi:cell division protein FtsL